MPDTAIFIAGLFTFGLVFGGLMLSVLELKRLGKEATAQTLVNNRNVSPPSQMNED